MTPLSPGATLGILGGGQLARMTAREAVRLGYRVHVMAPDADPPAAPTAHRTLRAEWSDRDALERFAAEVDVVTYELEGLPVDAVEWLAERRPVRPGPQLLRVAQDRRLERAWVERQGLPGPTWAPVGSRDELETALRTVGTPSLLKRARGGYDGRGQVALDEPAAAQEAWRELEEAPCVLEARVDFAAELSVIGARGLDGAIAVYGPMRNVHREGILDHSSFPAELPRTTASEAREIVTTVLEALAVVGVVCVELFLDREGGLSINEIAPRPHNSGHLTIEAHATSQFDQHVRTVLGLPLGSAAPSREAAAMANLLGDLWQRGEPHWTPVLRDGAARLHLYGKTPRPGRKVGHLTVVGERVDEVTRRALALREALEPRAPDSADRRLEGSTAGRG